MKRRKRILVLSSNGGYGHTAANKTLHSLLGDDYDIETVFPIKEVRLWGAPNGEAFYNFLLANNMNALVNFIVRFISPRLFVNRTEKIRRQIGKHVERHNADLLISLCPFVNLPATEAARDFGIPMLVCTTDNDLRKWALIMHKRRLENFTVTIGFDLPTSRNMLLKEGVPEESIKTFGLPLRPGFQEKKSKAELREKYEIAQGKKVVLIMLGGMGARSTANFAKVIGKSHLDAHIVVCTGRNKKLASRLRKLNILEGNTLHTVPFTEKIDELFALSDLVITKSGPGTINEAISQRLPILVDVIRNPLSWEKVNAEFVANQKIGAKIRSYREVPDLVRKYLYDAECMAQVAEAYEQIPENRFAEEIVPLIGELCEEPLSGEVATISRSTLS